METPILDQFLTESEKKDAHDKASNSSYFGFKLSDLTKDELLIMIWRMHQEEEEAAKRHAKDERFLGFLEGHINGLKKARQL
jgi:hypothetical protein